MISARIIMSTLLSCFEVWINLIDLYHGASPLIKRTRIENTYFILSNILYCNIGPLQKCKYPSEALQDPQLCFYKNLLNLSKDINQNLEKQDSLLMAKEAIL
jgi:hypothetical protein